MKKALVTVVIPIYQEKPSELEIISLDQTLAVLHEFPITFMTPTKLDTTWYEDHCRGKATIHFERFEWKGYVAFSALMTSPNFYKRFRSYQYMLICHMDAFVFRNELEKWCGMGYDYIGAVIYNTVFWNETTFLRRLTGFTTPEYFGNGGFALKNVETFYRMTSRFKFYIALYNLYGKMRRSGGFFDDLFVTQHFPKLSPSFKIAPRILAQDFGAAYETYNEADLPFNNRDNDSLPFGTHGWIQHHQDFWRPTIARYGYIINETPVTKSATAAGA